MIIRAAREMMLTLAIACLLLACGGGGGGATSTSISQATVVHGTVAANIVYPGIVRIYGVTADGILRLPALATGDTDSAGRYSVSINGYQGAIVGKSFGRYTDEATRAVIDIPEDKSLFAALPASEVIGKGSVSLNISPVSDLAHRKARSTTDFTGSIALSNQALSQLFGVDVVRVSPLSFDAFSLASGLASSDQTKLTAVLAVISQLSANGIGTSAVPTAADLMNTLAMLEKGITVTGSEAKLSSHAAYLLQEAVRKLAANAPAQPVIAAGGSAAQNMLAMLATIGSSAGNKAAAFRIRTIGNSGSKINGISASVGIPAGFTLGTDVNGTTLPNAILPSGQAAVNSLASGNISGSILTFNLVNALGFGLGECLTVYGEISVNSSFPEPPMFSPVTHVKVVDEDGGVISGISVEVF